MKKQITVLLTIVLMICLLAGCGKVRQVETAIDAIGTVTIDSLAQIEEVESLYNELEDKQDKVDNASVLQAARKEYDRLHQLVVDAETAMSAIASVTPASGDAIEVAQSISVALEAEDLEDYVDGFAEAIETAEKEFNRQNELIAAYDDAIAAVGTVTLDSKAAISAAEKAFNTLEKENLSAFADGEKLKKLQNQYDNLYVESCYAAIEALYEAKDYKEAIDAVWDLCNAYPDHDRTYDAFVIEAKANIALAQEAYDNNLLETATNYLDDATTIGRDLEEYKSLKEKLDKKIESSRPANGKKLTNKLGSSYCKLTVKNGSDDACVKLESVDNPDKYMLFYVRADSEVTVSVPKGRYNFKYTTGETWYGTTEMFGSKGIYSASRDPITFQLTFAGNYVTYTTMTITLVKAFGGNFSTEAIPPSGF